MACTLAHSRAMMLSALLLVAGQCPPECRAPDGSSCHPPACGQKCCQWVARVTAPANRSRQTATAASSLDTQSRIGAASDKNRSIFSRKGERAHVLCRGSDGSGNWDCGIGGVGAAWQKLMNQTTYCQRNETEGVHNDSEGVPIFLCTHEASVAMVKSLNKQLPSSRLHPSSQLSLALVIPVATCAPNCGSVPEWVIHATIHTFTRSWSKPRTAACASIGVAAQTDAPGRAMRCGQRGDLTSGAAMATPIFYTDVAIDQEVSNTIQQGWLASDACSACFERRPLLFVNAHSAEPSYPKGANIMFYRLVLALGRYPGFDYFMIMELDVVPVQPLWLESLVSLLPPRVPHFWIKGTAPRSESPSGFKRLHMNGNALYTARDPSFVIFVDHAVSRYGRSIEEGDGVRRLDSGFVGQHGRRSSQQDHPQLDLQQFYQEWRPTRSFRGTMHDICASVERLSLRKYSWTSALRLKEMRQYNGFRDGRAHEKLYFSCRGWAALGGPHWPFNG